MTPPPCDPTERAILMACAAPPGPARVGWDAWVATLSDHDAGPVAVCPPHLREMLPLLAWRRRDLGLAAPDWLQSHLNTALLLEQRRLGAVRTAHARILSCPALARADPVVVGGLALGETVYPDPACRHTSSVRLALAPGTRIAPILDELAALGYHPRPLGWGGRARRWLGRGAVVLRHPQSLSVALTVGMSGTGAAPPLGLGDGIEARAVVGATMFSWLAREAAAKLALPSRLWLVDTALLALAGDLPSHPNGQERAMLALVRNITETEPR